LRSIWKSFAIEQITDIDQSAEGAPRIRGELLAKKTPRDNLPARQERDGCQYRYKKDKDHRRDNRDGTDLDNKLGREIHRRSRKAAKEPVPAPGVEIENRLEFAFRRKDRKIPFHA